MGEIIGKGALALLPIIWLIVALTGLKMAGHKALSLIHISEPTRPY